MPSVSFQAPTDYSTDLADIERRRKYAEMLQQQSMQPVQAQPTPANGFAVPISWTQGLAKALQGYSARKGLEKATEDQKALTAQYNAERSQALAAAIAAGQGRPAQTIQPDPQEAQQAADQGTPEVGPVQQPAVPANRGAMLAALTGSKFPDLQQVGLAQTLAENKPYVVGKSLMDASGRVIGSDPTFTAEAEAKRMEASEQAAAQRQQRQSELEARLQDQRLAREDRATLQRELQASREQSARELRTLAGSLRQPQVQPLVQVMTPNGPQWVERKDAIGKMPAGAGSKAEMQESGKADVDKDVIKLKSMLDRLREGGGITDTTRGPLANIGAAMGATGIGQAV